MYLQRRVPRECVEASYPKFFEPMRPDGRGGQVWGCTKTEWEQEKQWEYGYGSGSGSGTPSGAGSPRSGDDDACGECEVDVCAPAAAARIDPAKAAALRNALMELGSLWAEALHCLDAANAAISFSPAPPSHVTDGLDIECHR
jgi:hypothetical protein